MQEWISRSGDTTSFVLVVVLAKNGSDAYFSWPPKRVSPQSIAKCNSLEECGAVQKNPRVD